MLDLFTQPERWRRVRAEVDVFKFYSSQLLAESNADCPECGRNTLPSLSQAQAFTRLRSWGIATAIETATFKWWDCRAESTFPLIGRAIHNIERHGAIVNDVAFDEPLLGAVQCGLSIEAAAERQAAFMLLLSMEHPSVAFGDIEPFPYFTVEQLEHWLAELKRGHATPAFFHLDVDRARVVRSGVNVTSALSSLEAFCQIESIPFGVILTDNEASTDRDYYEEVLRWTATVNAAIGAPQHVVIQSWVVSPDGRRVVPRNLPESGPEVHSHTRLIRDALTILGARRRLP